MPNRSAFGVFPAWRPTAPPAKAVQAYAESETRSAIEASRPGPSPQDEIARQADRREWQQTEKLARLSTEAPRIPWDKFLDEELQWRSGEHFALIGPTGQGKTTMMLHLLPLHPFVAAFATKPRDETMDSLIATGYIKLERWQFLDPDIFPRRVIWPDATRIDSEDVQRSVFADAFGKIYREGGWTVAIDETWYFANVLRMEKYIRTYLLQARSLGISLLCATQRPASVPLEIYDQSTHLMFWRDNDETNLRRLGGISYRSADLIRGIVSNLERFQVLYINTRTGRMVRTRCPAINLPVGR
jgi:energy-coupling factor transporter ATP-binding protein EcfA2